MGSGLPCAGLQRVTDGAVSLDGNSHKAKGGDTDRDSYREEKTGNKVRLLAEAKVAGGSWLVFKLVLISPQQLLVRLPLHLVLIFMVPIIIDNYKYYL